MSAVAAQMRVLIIGLNSITFEVARRLYERGIKIGVITKNKALAEKLLERVDADVIVGDYASTEFLVRNQDVLREADLVIVSAQSDDLNLLVSTVVKSLGAKRVVALTYNGSVDSILSKLGVDSINVSLITAFVVSEYVSGDTSVMNVIKRLSSEER